MVSDWWIEDCDFFTVDLFTALDAIAPVDMMTTSNAVHSAASYAKNSLADPKLDFILLFALIACILSLKRRDIPVIAGLVLLILAISVTFTMLGRLPQRVHYPLWMFLIVVVSSFAHHSGIAMVAGCHGRSASTASNAKAGLSIFTTVVPVIAAMTTLFFAFSNFSVDRMLATYTPATFKPESSLSAYYDAHPDLVFVQNQNANWVIRFSYRLRGLPERDLIYRSCSMGGWETHSPFRQAQYQQLGMENVLKGLVENDKARLILGGAKPDSIQKYLREHYYPECTYTLVDTIECPETDATLKVYDFSAQ
jgi:hypothetical protein